MKLSQLKKILKESAKEAVIEVLNEISSQNTFAPQRINESFVTPNLANNLRNMFTQPSQNYQPQYQPPVNYSQPPMQQQPSYQPPVPKVLPTTALGSLMGTIANKMTAEDFHALDEQIY